MLFCSVLLCVLEQPRVDNSNSSAGAQLGAILVKLALNPEYINSWLCIAHSWVYISSMAISDYFIDNQIVLMFTNIEFFVMIKAVVIMEFFCCNRIICVRLLPLSTKVLLFCGSIKFYRVENLKTCRICNKLQ